MLYERETKMLNKKKTLANINMLYNARNDAIKFIEDYGPMILEAKKNWQENKKEQDLKY